MFTMLKTEFPRQFHVYADTVTELLGEHLPENEPHYQPCEYEEDLDFAIQQAVDFREMQIEKDIWFLEKAISNGKWLKFWIKSFWNPKIKKALADHYTKLKVQNAFLLGHSKDDVNVTLLEDKLIFLGYRKEIGTELFMVDLNSLTIRTSKVTGYSAWDYKNHKLHFSNTLNFLIDSLSFESGRAAKLHNPVFETKEEAEFVLKEAIKTRMAELADQSKQIGV